MVLEYLLYNSSTIHLVYTGGPGWLNEFGRWIYKPITNTACVRPQLCKFAHGWWFSPASSTTKTGRHDNRVADKKKILSDIGSCK